MNTQNIISENLKVMVFRSDIDTPQKVLKAREALRNISDVYTVDVDLEDHENVLRLECHPGTPSEQIEAQIANLGFSCSELT